MERLELLKKISFGSQVAEDEMQLLKSYFVETDYWNRIIGGKIDIIRGEKGSGKSAIYLLLGSNRDFLFDHNILLVSGENTRGSTVFKDLISDPPTSEPEFVVLWKIYILAIVCHELRDLGVTDGEIGDVYGALEGSGLLEPKLNLSSLLRTVQSIARRLLTKTKIEAGLEFDQNSGLPTAITGRIALDEPSKELRSRGISSIDGMFNKVNESLATKGFAVWVLLDRLDVAFAESHELEANAIRALMRVYSDLRANDNISLKVFLREDIWKRVTDGGLREASHIIRTETMEWTPPMLLNLLMRRILSNEILVSELKIDKEEILKDSKKQDELFTRLFPPQVEQGPQKATTFKWMITRCADGTEKTAPRELIHLLNSIRNEEIKRLERGGSAPPHGQLFDRSVFKAALPTVSNTRLNTYLYAEFPSERPFLEKLHGQKSEQNPDSLAAIWGMTREDAIKKAGDLVAVGFFRPAGSRMEPAYWVPFLYRDALSLVQGKADSEES